MRNNTPKLTLVRNSPSCGTTYDEDWGYDYYALNRFETKKRNGVFVCVKEVELFVLSHAKKFNPTFSELKPDKFFFDKFVRYSDKLMTFEERNLVHTWCTDDVTIESDTSLDGIISAREYDKAYKGSKGCLMYVTQKWFEEFTFRKKGVNHD